MNNLFLAFAVLAFSTPALSQNNFYAEFLAGKTDLTANSETIDDDSFGVRAGYQFTKYVAADLTYWQYMNERFNENERSESGDMSVGFYSSEELNYSNNVDLTAWNLGMKGSYPITDKLSVNGQLGLSRWDFSDEAYGSGTFIDLFDGVETSRGAFENAGLLEDSGTDIYYGVGIQYDLNERLYVGLEYFQSEIEISSSGFELISSVTSGDLVFSEDDDVENDGDARIDIETLSLSLGWKF